MRILVSIRMFFQHSAFLPATNMSVRVGLYSFSVQSIEF